MKRVSGTQREQNNVVKRSSQSGQYSIPSRKGESPVKKSAQIEDLVTPKPETSKESSVYRK